MRTVQITCDHCGKQLDEREDYTDFEIDAFNLFSVDLCKECRLEVATMVRSFCGRKTTKRN